MNKNKMNVFCTREYERPLIKVKCGWAERI